MKKIEIKKLSLLNFKGIRKLEINDFAKETKIFGDNATGKTSIFDAFSWLLFGKDSNDRTQFEIKTLDKNNNVIHKLDHEVSAILLIDDEEVALSRTLKEKWVKKRGALEAEYTGNETSYTWDEVPVSAGEFSKKISEIVDENVFKLITSPTAFNSLKWQDQRQELISISGGVTDAEIAKGDTDFEKLIQTLGSKSLEDYQKQIKASLRKSKNDIKMLPTRIDEVERGKPESFEFDSLRKVIKQLESESSKIDKQISSRLEGQKSYLDNKTKIQSDIHKLESEISDVKHQVRLKAKSQFQNANSGLDALKSELSEIETDKESSISGLEVLNSKLTQKEKEVETIESEMESLRESWVEINASEFNMDENELACPTCERDFEADKVEEMTNKAKEKFKQNKVSGLDAKNKQGKEYKAIKEKVIAEIDKLKGRIKNGEKYFEKLKAKEADLLAEIDKAETSKSEASEESVYIKLLSNDTSIKEKEDSIKSLKADFDKLKEPDVSEFRDAKDILSSKIDNLKKDLSAEDVIKRSDDRIKEIESEETTLAQVISNYEREEFVIDNFIKAKISTLEEKINSRFKIVKFKMFETLVNGAEVETCKALVDGVPYSDLNNAMQINSGIDIINTLSEYYGVSSVIFLDNAESVTETIPTESQLVKLIVSKQDKKLRVETK